MPVIPAMEGLEPAQVWCVGNIGGLLYANRPAAFSVDSHSATLPRTTNVVFNQSWLNGGVSTPFHELTATLDKSAVHTITIRSNLCTVVNFPIDRLNSSPSPFDPAYQDALYHARESGGAVRVVASVIQSKDFVYSFTTSSDLEFESHLTALAGVLSANGGSRKVKNNEWELAVRAEQPQTIAWRFVENDYLPTRPPPPPTVAKLQLISLTCENQQDSLNDDQPYLSVKGRAITNQTDNHLSSGHTLGLEGVSPIPIGDNLVVVLMEHESVAGDDRLGSFTVNASLLNQGTQESTIKSEKKRLWGRYGWVYKVKWRVVP
jgi:hypothetical protein